MSDETDIESINTERGLACRGLAGRRHADHRRIRAHPAAQARRLSHDRRRRRGPLCRQGALAAQPGRRLHPADPAGDAPDAHGVGDPDHGVLGHRQRGRGAAAREQPDQALPAALQRAAARRQVVSLHRHPQATPNGRSSPSIAARASRPTSISAPSPRPPRSTARSMPCSAPSRCAPAPTACSSTRTRPCLQYQIKRCTAPCVGRIDKAEYGAIVDEVRGFLGGRNREVQQALSQRMDKASAEPGVRARGGAARPHPRAGPHPVAPVDHAALDRRGRHLRRPCRGRAGLRAGVLPARRPESRQPRLLPGPCPRARRAGGAVGLHRPVLRIAPGAQADPDQPRRRRTRVARKRARHDGRSTRSRSAIPSAATRRTRSTRPSLNAREALARRMAERGTQRQLLEGVARAVRPGRTARAHRDLRQQPHPGQRADRRHGRRRAGRLHQEFISQVQHQDRGRGGRRFRHDARGADAPLRPRAARRIPSAPRSIGPTWC